MAFKFCNTILYSWCNLLLPLLSKIHVIYVHDCTQTWVSWPNSVSHIFYNLPPRITYELVVNPAKIIRWLVENNRCGTWSRGKDLVWRNGIWYPSRWFGGEEFDRSFSWAAARQFYVIAPFNQLDVAARERARSISRLVVGRYQKNLLWVFTLQQRICRDGKLSLEKKLS